MPNPNTNFKDSDGVDLGSKLITKEYLMTVYPQIANQLITPELWIWGRNDYAHLGLNDTTQRNTPVTTFAGGANWKQVSGGQYHTAAVKTDGTLWTWGRNPYGELGTNFVGTTNGRSTPVTTFAGGADWKQVACGTNHTAAIKTDGTLWTWGYGLYGATGTGVTNNRDAPGTTFAGGTNWKQVACGGFHTAAVKTDGTLWTWGRNTEGQLGINDDLTKRLTPVTTFAGGTNWKQVDACQNHTAAVKTDGTLWTWGDNANGGLGDNTGTTRCTPVTTFAGGTNWKQVACGELHSTAIKTDGTLWGWGYSGFGQLGNNDSASTKLTPVTTFAGGTNWKQVACGRYYTAAIKTDGTLWTWGYNAEGNLGTNNVSGSITPVTTFAGGTNWKQVECGYWTTTAIETSDDLIGI